MFSWWAYFFCVLGVCCADIERQNNDEFEAFFKHLSSTDHDLRDISEKNINTIQTLAALDLKMENLVNGINDLKELTKDKVGFLARGVEMIASEQQPQNGVVQLDTGDFNTLKDLCQVLHDTSVSVSSDMKTLLNETSEIIEKTNDCGSDASDTENQMPGSCLELQNKGHTQSGVYRIYVASLGEAIEVYCDQETEGGGWIVFQRREDGSVDFYRNWHDYKTGFGDPKGEFWLGLERLHHLTTSVSHDLRIDLGDAQGNRRYAKYSKFIVDSEASGYRLTAEGYSGSAGNSFGKGSGYHNVRPFSTKDSDNENRCAVKSNGGWWYDSGSCHLSNLNGLYLVGNHRRYYKGITWFTWKGYSDSLTFTEMKIREKI